MPEILFPVYSRIIHEPVPDAVNVSGDIILLEGNWLLLDEEPWISLRRNADYVVRMEPADPAVLRGRLISRKAEGGSSPGHQSQCNAPMFYSVLPELQKSSYPSSVRICRNCDEIIFSIAKDPDLFKNESIGVTN